MDDFKKILRAYKSSLENEYNFHGIIITPIFLEDSIVWEFKNPNDLSVSRSSIYGFIVDLFFDFSKYIGGTDLFYAFNNKVCKLIDKGYFKKGGVYLNKYDMSVIWNVLNGIKQIRFKGGVLDIDIVGVSFDTSHYEDFTMTFDVVIERAYFNDMELTRKDMLKSLLEKMFYHDDFRDYEYDLFSRVNVIIATNPLIFDDNFMYLTHDITPFDKNGNKININ